MNSLKTILAASLAITGFGVAQGANVVITSLAAGPAAQPAKKVVTSAVTDVAQNSIVRVGFFNLGGGDPTVLLSGNVFSSLAAMFTPLGEDPVSAADGTTGPVKFNATGGIGGSVQNVDNAFMPAGNELYAWVFAQPTADATATQWAIFRDASWVMPSGIGSINLQTWQIDQSTEVFKGTLDNVNNRILMAPVPEPASALLGLIGLGMTLRRRRA